MRGGAERLEAGADAVEFARAIANELREVESFAHDAVALYPGWRDQLARPAP